MKTVGKMVLTLVAMMTMVATASATDKLIVNNTGGSAVFKVDDGGNITVPSKFKFDTTNNFLGIGTEAPGAAFHLNYKTAAAPFLLERELDNSGAVSLTADNYAAANGGSLVGSGMLFRFSKGTKASPSNVASGDRLGFLVFGGMAGGSMKHTAAINSLVDAGTVSGTSLPTYMQFMTTADGSTSRLERMRIAGDGRIRLSNQPTAPISGTTACTAGDMILDAANGFLYLCTAAPNTWKKATFN